MTQATRDWVLRSRPFLVYPAVIVALIVFVMGRGAVKPGLGAALMAGGLFTWTLVEWVLHRAMHIRPRSAVMEKFLEEAHIQHHRQPKDLEHSVTRLSATIPLCFMFFGLWMAAFRDLDRALLFHAGLLIGYVMYEMVHLASHGAWKLPFMVRLNRYHAKHHYGSWNRTFGVTTPLWDWVFGTLPQSRAEKTRTQPASSAAN